MFDTYGLVDLGVGLVPGNPAAHSPGHDKQVAPAHFLDQDPTYFRGTALVPSNAPYFGLPTELLEDPALAALFDVEWVALDDTDAQLRLVRYRGAASNE